MIRFYIDLLQNKKAQRNFDYQSKLRWAGKLMMLLWYVLHPPCVQQRKNDFLHLLGRIGRRKYRFNRSFFNVTCTGIARSSDRISRIAVSIRLPSCDSLRILTAWVWDGVQFSCSIVSRRKCCSFMTMPFWERHQRGMKRKKEEGCRT